jgi:hypothetical protein
MLSSLRSATPHSPTNPSTSIAPTPVAGLAALTAPAPPHPAVKPALLESQSTAVVVIVLS